MKTITAAAAAAAAAVLMAVPLTSSAAAVTDVQAPQGRVAYSEQTSDSWRLMVMRADGTNPRPLGNLDWVVDPDWSPDGRRIAVSGFHPGTFGAAQIFVMAADGTGARAVTFQPGYKRSPSWSPDGQQIAYDAAVETTSPSVPWTSRYGCELRVVDLHTGRERVVHAMGRYAQAYPYTWAFPATYVWAFAGSDCAAFPRWSPRGDWLVFTQSSSAEAGAAAGYASDLYVSDLYLIRPDGTGLRRIVEDVTLGAAWSPDGRRIAYVAADIVGDRTIVRTVAPDGTDVRDVTTIGVDGGFPTYAPDGRFLLIQSSDSGGHAQLYRVPLAGGSPVQLTKGNVHHEFPDWTR